MIVLPGGAAEMALAVVVALLYTLLSALAALALGLKMPNLTWTNEDVYKRQPAAWPSSAELFFLRT